MPISRRRLLSGAAGVLASAGCTKEDRLPAACTDTSGLSFDETAARSKVAYADVAAQPEKRCDVCQQWLPPPKSGACGGCKLLKGPIHPKGSCKAFAPKA